MTTVKVSITGLAELKAKIKAMPAIAEAAAHAELKKVTLDLQGKAQQLAPLDTGDLRGSAFSEVEGLDGTTGFAEVYALRQHEHVEYRHPKGGQALYLQEPYEANREKYIKGVNNAVINAVEKA